VSFIKFEVKKGLRKKGVAFSLPPDWAIQQWVAQDGKCFYTGLPLTDTRGSGRVWSNVSIDRVDSQEGYTPENCVLCCRAVNTMKNEYSLGTIEMLCKAFLAHQEGIEHARL
jgi:hypothetical protein